MSVESESGSEDESSSSPDEAPARRVRLRGVASERAHGTLPLRSTSTFGLQCHVDESGDVPFVPLAFSASFSLPFRDWFCEMGPRRSFVPEVAK